MRVRSSSLWRFFFPTKIFAERVCLVILAQDEVGGQATVALCFASKNVFRHGESSRIDPLNIARGQTSSPLDELKLHWNSGSDRAVALSRKRSEVKEDLIAWSFSRDHADTRMEIEPAYDSLCYRQTVRTQCRTSIDPLLLGNANPPHLWCVICLVAVIGTFFHARAQITSQLFSSRAANEVPAVIDGVDAQVWPQHKRVRLCAIGILAFRLVENVDLLDDGPLFVG